MKLLLTNDDGVDSPSLIPVARSLLELDGVSEVRVIVPDRERSWIGKAITRFEEIGVERVSLAGLEISTCSGTPADCTNLGIYSLWPDRPDFVVSGINVGLNSGSAFALSSGTLGAAVEAHIAGVPAAAFSLGPPEADRGWPTRARSAQQSELWQRAANLTATLVARLAKLDLPDEVDVVSVNIPEDLDDDPRLEVTDLLETHYRNLFREVSPGRFAHDFQGWKPRSEMRAGTDQAAVRAGAVSVTPLRLTHGPQLAREVLGALEAPVTR